MADRPTERRFIGTVELRAGATGPQLHGYAAVFNSPADIGGFVEQVDPRAFDQSLRSIQMAGARSSRDIVATRNHDMNQLLGRTSNGTLRLSTDAHGLAYSIDVNPDDPMAASTLAQVKRGDLNGSSFQFQTIDDSWDYGGDVPSRTLKEVRLIELGPVAMPAYPATTADARSALERAGGMRIRMRQLDAELELYRAIAGL